MKATFLFFIAWLWAVLLAACPAAAAFIGTLEFAPPGCEQAGICILLQDFKYIDPNKTEWLTVKGDKTDGASIPTWAQPFIGEPFDKSYIKAAVIHDHYCDRHVRTWRDTHRVFYDALIELGVNVAKAKLMYYAVYLGGPKWVDLIPGKPCPNNSKNCLWNLAIDQSFESKAAKPAVISRPADYEQPGFQEELKNVEKLLNEQGDMIDLKALEQRAEHLRPDDFFYKHPDRVTVRDVGFISE
jgi:hypothetical protein